MGVGGVVSLVDEIDSRMDGQLTVLLALIFVYSGNADAQQVLLIPDSLNDVVGAYS